MNSQKSRPAIIVGVACATLLMAGCDAPSKTVAIASDPMKGSPYKPAATFQDVMDSVVDPASDYIWKAVATTSDAKGIHETRPRNDAEWHELRRRAILLVEAANLVSVPGRKVAAGTTTVEDKSALEVDKIQQRLDTQHEELVGFADALRDIGLKLVADADRNDAAGIADDGGTLDEVCESCHKVFWYPDQPVPPPKSK